jgi:hypothetical protein
MHPVSHVLKSMLMPDPKHPHVNRTSSRASISVALTVLAILACLLAARPGKPSTPLNISGFTDPEILEHIIDRVRHGETYYDAASTELRADHFHVRSVFNWREPLYAWFLAACPSPIFGQVLLAALTIAMTLLAARCFIRTGDRLAAALALLLVPGASYGAFVPWGATTLEIWAGVLVAISIFTYAADRCLLAVIIALLALFIRELTAPYIAICVLLALLNHRPRELFAWTIGLLLFAAYFAFHFHQVTAHIHPTDAPDPIGWLRFGGIHFILTTAAQHVIFLPLPLWTVAIYLPLSVLGLTALRGDLGMRATLTVAAYLLFFAFVGKSFNDYWGFLYSPLLALGFASVSRATARMWRFPRNN